jgi:hypothetical protein
LKLISPASKKFGKVLKEEEESKNCGGEILINI